MSETNKWTPGKWEVGDVLYAGDSYRYREISSPESAVWIAHVLGFDSTEASPEPSRCVANANLIAAAPEMYEALLNIKGLFDTPVERRRRQGDEFYAEAMRGLNDALKKARGEQC